MKSTLKGKVSWAVVAHTVNTNPWEAEEEDLCSVGGSLVY